MESVDPVDLDIAMEACIGILEEEERDNCTMDVVVTGETEFAVT